MQPRCVLDQASTLFSESLVDLESGRLILSSLCAADGHVVGLGMDNQRRSPIAENGVPNSRLG